MHQRVSLSLSFQFFSNNFKIILSINVRQLLYLSSHECCNLVETLGIVDKRLLSDLIGSWTRPVLDSAVSFTTVCVLSRWNQCDLVYVLFIQDLHICTYVLDKRRITYPYDAFWSRGESMSAVKRVMQVSCTRFKDEKYGWFCEKQGNRWFLTAHVSLHHRSLIHYSRNSSKKQCQRVGRSSIDLWKMPFTSRSIGSRKLALTMTRYKNSRIPRSFWYRPRRAFLPAWNESRPRFETQNTRSRKRVGRDARRFLYRNFRSPRGRVHNTSEVAIVRSRVICIGWNWLIDNSA